MEFPSDVEEEILLRVPAKSLVRFKLVCRRWNSMLRDPSFVRKHLSLHRCSNQGFMLWDYRVADKLMHMDVGNDVFACELEMSIPRLHITHCDGLLLCVWERGIVVLNPCLRQQRLIETETLEKDHRKEYTFGLGHDKNNSYKIVRFVAGSRSRNSEIYELTTGVWRDLDVAELDWSTVEMDRTISSTGAGYSASLEGTSYWLAIRRDDRRRCFVQSFDFSEERFEPLCDLPFSYSRSYSYGLSVLRGNRLSVLRQSKTLETEIWTTNKIGDSEVTVTWSKFASFRSLECCHRSCHPRHFIDHNDNVVICVKRNDGSAGTFIFGKDKITISYSKPCRAIRACNYVPSLVHLT